AQIVKTLTKFGHKVTLIARERDSSIENVSFVPIRYRARGSILKTYFFFTKVRKMLMRAGFDVVYGLSRVYPTDVFRVSDPLHAAWIERRYHGKLPHHLVNLSLRHQLILALERKVITDSQVQIVCNSRLVATEIEKFYELPQSSSRLRVIYNGVDQQQFNPAVRKAGKHLREQLNLQNKTVLLFVGADVRRKGFETLVKAMSSFRQKELYLLAVGLTRKDVSFSLPATVQERITFLGRVSDPETYYGAADLLVLPTRYDPFANVCLEALACGTPVVTTTSNGASEIIESGQTGFIMEDPQSDEELMEKLAEYLSLTESGRGLMGEQAAHRAAQYTWERHGKALLEVFEGIGS
ncbi:MAG: glycosyltransferase family 4 protein, partial [Syntrophobacterales bacterium]